MSAPLKSPVIRTFSGEARLILPVRDNDRKGLGRVADSLRARLIDEFGGYTETAAFGGYRDTSIQTEMVRVFDIACDMLDHARLVALASWLAREALQDSVYLRSPSGTVFLVAGEAK